MLEVIVAMAVFMVIIVGSLAANNLTTTTVVINKKRSQANVLVKEGIEALQSVRAANFNSLMVGDFHPAVVSGMWTLVPGSETIGDLTRVITLSPVMRALVCATPICDIVPSGGLIDPLSFMATVKVSWNEGSLAKNYQVNTEVSFWR